MTFSWAEDCVSPARPSATVSFWTSPDSSSGIPPVIRSFFLAWLCCSCVVFQEKTTFDTFKLGKYSFQHLVFFNNNYTKTRQKMPRTLWVFPSSRSMVESSIGSSHGVSNSTSVVFGMSIWVLYMPNLWGRESLTILDSYFSS